jgi:hypothetical protein
MEKEELLSKLELIEEQARLTLDEYPRVAGRLQRDKGAGYALAYLPLSCGV